MDNTMRAGVQASEKAAYYADKARTAENNDAISSDNPEAINLLAEKIAALEKKQEAFKGINVIVRNKKLTHEEKVAKLMADFDLKEATATELLNPDQFGGAGVPRFTLTNNAAKIRAARERLEYLTRMAAIESSEEMIGDIKLIVSTDDNRVQLVFPGKPAEEIRTDMKRNGFRYSYTAGAWQRMLTTPAIRIARALATKFTTPQQS